MITFDYNYKEDHLETNFTDKINHGDIINYLNNLQNNYELPKNLKTLITVNSNGTDVNPSKLFLILEENIKLFEMYNTIRVAIITTTPTETALAVIYARLIQLQRYKFQVFSSRKAAIAWLNKVPNKDKKHIYPKRSFLNELHP